MNPTQEIEPILFMAKWDDEIGPVIIDLYPKRILGDMESLAFDIFQSYEYFFDHSKNPFQKTQITLPIRNIDKKINVLFSINPDDENVGKNELSFVSILLPSYFEQDELNIYNNILRKIIQRYFADRSILLKDFYPEILEKLKLKTVESEIEEKLDDYYSYTAAVNDFKAALNLYNKKQYDESLNLLKKVQVKFKEENQKKLLIEVLYIIASIFAQNRDFLKAKKKFNELYQFSSEVHNNKFRELSAFMLGFSNYKLENYRNAVNNFEQIKKNKIEYINVLNFQNLYANTCLRLKLFNKAERLFKEALKLVEDMSFKPQYVKKKAHLLYSLGLVYYELAFHRLRIQGIFSSKEYHQYLIKAKSQFIECKSLLNKLKDWDKFVLVCLVLSNILSNLDELKLSLLQLKDAFDITDKLNLIPKKLHILYKIIRVQSELELYNGNLLIINEFLKKSEYMSGLDLFNRARLHEYLADSYLSLNRMNNAEKELLESQTLYDKITIPLYENINVINKLIQIYTNKKDYEKIEYFSKKLHSVSKSISLNNKTAELDLHPLGEVREIWLFSNNSGILLFTHSPETDFDIDLIGGFLTALKQFSVELTQDEIDSMNIGTDRYTFYQDPHLDFFILGRSKIKSSPEKVNKILKIIYQRFWKEYSDEIKSFIGNIKVFDGFSDIIKNLDLTLV